MRFNVFTSAPDSLKAKKLFPQHSTVNYFSHHIIFVLPDSFPNSLVIFLRWYNPFEIFAFR